MFTLNIKDYSTDEALTALYFLGEFSRTCRSHAHLKCMKRMVPHVHVAPLDRTVIWIIAGARGMMGMATEVRTVQGWRREHGLSSDMWHHR